MAIVIPPPFAQTQAVLSLLPPSIASIGASALPGETIAIFGANFFNITSVDFNGTPASFSVQDQRWISVAVPAGATTGPIHVVNKLGVATSVAFSPFIPQTPFRAAFPIAYTTETNGGTPTVYTRSIVLPSDVSVVTATKMRNAYQSGGVGLSFSSNVALASSDGTGAAGANLATWLAQTVPGDGTDLVLGPTTIAPRASDNQIVHLMSLPPAAVCSCSVTPQIHGTYSAGTATVNPAPGISGSDPTPICWIHFDYSTAKRKLGFITDSIGAGVNSATGFNHSFPQQLAATKDYAVLALSLPGSGLGGWAAFGSTSAAWWADGIYGPSTEWWIQPGVNDIGGGSSATMIANFTAIVAHLRNDLGVIKIYANTLAPNNSVNETVRLAHNSFVIANSLGLTGIYDAAAPQSAGGMADNSNTAVLYAPFDSGDHLHPSDAGQTQFANGVMATVH